MKVALKFCGGCDPGYDRVEYWERIRGAAGDRIDWVSLDADHYDAVLLICGCKTMCPRDEISRTECLVTISDDEMDAESVVALLESCLTSKIGEARKSSTKGVSQAWKSRRRKTIFEA
jgi:hypothetical protein